MSPEAHALSQQAENVMGSLYVGQGVLTTYGRGKIIEKRIRDVVVQIDPTCWVLAYGQAPTLYLHPTQIIKEPTISPLLGGEIVNTPFGEGESLHRSKFVVASLFSNWLRSFVSGAVLSRRPGKSGQLIVESTKWKLANCSLPRFYLEDSLVTRASISVGDRVMTPYGAGVLIEKRVTDYVVQPNASVWRLAYGQKPTYYLSPDQGELIRR